MKLLSELPDAKYFESDEKSKVKTKLSCPSKYFSTFLVYKSIKAIFLPQLAANKLVPF